MPIQVQIQVNYKTVQTINIGRLSGGTEPDDLNMYSAVVSPRHPSINQWNRGKKFVHRYGDGLETCVRKALERLGY